MMRTATLLALAATAAATPTKLAGAVVGHMQELNLRASFPHTLGWRSPPP